MSVHTKIVALCLILMAPFSRARAAAQLNQPQFWTGADLSALPFRESHNFKYSDAQGEADLLQIARRNGWNIIRVALVGRSQRRSV